jgi:hypothetical protein
MEKALAKWEIDRYLSLGVARSDVALLVASWGFEAKELEELNWYLHDKVQIKKKKNKGIEI